MVPMLSFRDLNVDKNSKDAQDNLFDSCRIRSSFVHRTLVCSGKCVVASTM